MTKAVAHVHPATWEFRIANEIAYRYFAPEDKRVRDLRFYHLRNEIHQALLAAADKDEAAA